MLVCVALKNQGSSLLVEVPVSVFVAEDSFFQPLSYMLVGLVQDVSLDNVTVPELRQV